MLLLVNLVHLCNEICSITVSKFLYSIHTCSLKKFCKLRTDTLYSIEVSMVSPSKDEFTGDTCLLLERLTACRSSTLFKKLVSINDACSVQLFGIKRADTFNVNDFVSHIF